MVSEDLAGLAKNMRTAKAAIVKKAASDARSWVIVGRVRNVTLMLYAIAEDSEDTPWRAGMARRLIRKNINSKQTLISTLAGHKPLVLRDYIMVLQQCDWSSEMQTG